MHTSWLLDEFIKSLRFNNLMRDDCSCTKMCLQSLRTTVLMAKEIQ